MKVRALAYLKVRHRLGKPSPALRSPSPGVPGEGKMKQHFRCEMDSPSLSPSPRTQPAVSVLEPGEGRGEGFSSRVIAFSLLCAALLFTADGCMREDMGSQPKAKTMQESVIFADETTARPLVDGTVARGAAELDSHFNAGFVDGKPAINFPDHYPTETDGPFPTGGPALRNVLTRGREQFTIYCAMCHGDAGDGRGMIVQRGMVPPPSYHIDRLRQAPVGHLFDVITSGYGQMFSYGDRVAPADRWAIAAYIRTLQMSQAMPTKNLQPGEVDAERSGAR
jgi:mono/diheme cytochrome c family protein